MQDIEAILNESLRLEAADQFNRALAHIVEARKAHPQQRVLAIRHGQLLERIKQPQSEMSFAVNTITEIKKVNDHEIEIITGGPQR